jgi:hypothetical protein
MALPSIVLLIVFACAVFLAACYSQTQSDWVNLIAGGQPTVVAGAAFVTVLLVALHYWRFRVPITVAAGCAALTATVLGLFNGLVPNLPGTSHAVIFMCGLAVFALAMQYDTADLERRTRRTDIAFWLHLLAAPLIVHSVTRGLVTKASELDPGTAVAIMAIFLALSFIAVLIDRRAMLVSGLAYAGVAFWALIRQAGISGMTTPLTILALGAFVLLLSAGWRPLRAGILSIVPRALTQHLPRASLVT